MQITLYQFENCPYCAKVRAKLEDLGLAYEKVNVSNNRDDPLRQEIAENSGIQTVPVIKIDDEFIGDSQKIIDYLDKNLAS
jgi:glutaredoxin 3